jgi:hypothetical protein
MKSAGLLIIGNTRRPMPGFPEYQNLRTVALATRQAILGGGAVAKDLFQFFSASDWLFHLIFVEHILKNGSVSLTFTKLPMSFRRYYDGLYVMTLEKTGKFLAAKLPCTVAHQLSRWTCPTEPMGLHLGCHFFGGSAFAQKGYLEIGTSV